MAAPGAARQITAPRIRKTSQKASRSRSRATGPAIQSRAAAAEAIAVASIASEIHSGWARQYSPGRSQPISHWRRKAVSAASAMASASDCRSAAADAAAPRPGQPAEAEQQRPEQRQPEPERQRDEPDRRAHRCRGAPRRAGAEPPPARSAATGKRLLAHVAQAARVERGDGVAGAVIAGLVADDGEVEDRPAAAP